MIAIIGILAGLLLPALSEALDSARKIACANNLKQLGTATLMYHDDNRALPERGYWGRSLRGDLGSNYCMNNLYADYLGGKIELDGSGRNSAMRFSPNPVVICPSNPKPNYYRISYSYISGSVRNHRITLTHLNRVFAIELGKGNVSGRCPGIWSDRCNFLEAGNNGGVAETNHKTGEKPQGGNVVHIDTSVKWFKYLDNAQVIDNEFILNGGVVGGHILIPRNTLAPLADDMWKLNPAKPQWIAGRGWPLFY